jgi:hypothetical protein
MTAISLIYFFYFFFFTTKTKCQTKKKKEQLNKLTETKIVDLKLTYKKNAHLYCDDYDDRDDHADENDDDDEFVRKHLWKNVSFYKSSPYANSDYVTITRIEPDDQKYIFDPKLNKLTIKDLSIKYLKKKMHFGLQFLIVLNYLDYLILLKIKINK